MRLHDTYVCTIITVWVRMSDRPLAVSVNAHNSKSKAYILIIFCKECLSTLSNNCLTTGMRSRFIRWKRLCGAYGQGHGLLAKMPITLEPHNIHVFNLNLPCDLRARAFSRNDHNQSD